MERDPLALPAGLWHNTFAMSRWMRFLIAILMGIALGLLYGWVINPIQHTDSSPDTLKTDYKTDYILMVAEAYQTEQNLPLAVQRLGLLGNIAPDEMAHQAILFAEQIGYKDADLALMRSLWEGLKTYHPILETATP